MQGTAEGDLLRDIQEAFSVSRRTAERMRDAVLQIYPQAEEVQNGDGLKRWRIPSRRNGPDIPISADELATVRAAANRLRQDGRQDQALVLDALTAKLKSLLSRKALCSLEPDYEALVQAEGLCLRPGPREKVAAQVMENLREAILGCRQVVLHYRSRSTERFSCQTVHPYGFLHGTRRYLVAYNTNPDAEGFRLFSLARIERAEMSPLPFRRDPDFRLDEYAANSFGCTRKSRWMWSGVSVPTL